MTSIAKILDSWFHWSTTDDHMSFNNKPQTNLIIFNINL